MNSLPDWMSDSRTVWVCVCAGLAVLALALLVLARLRWIQSRPIATCVVLSVFAHILLIFSAYMTQLLDELPPMPRQESIRLSIARHDQADPDSPAREPVSRPWDRLTTDLPKLPTPAVVTRDAWEDLGPTRSPEVPPPPEGNDEASSVAIPGEHAASLPPAPDASELPQAPPHAVAPVAPGDTVVTEPESEDSMAAPDTNADPSADDPPSEEPIDVAGSDNSSAADRPQLVETEPTTESSPTAVGPMDQLEPSAPNPDDADPVAPRVATARSRRETTPTAPGSTYDDSRWLPSDATAEGGKTTSPPVGPRLVNGRRLPRAYWLRFAPDRLRHARQRGANDQTEAAVANALLWLARSQRQDGRWDASATGAGRELRISGQDRAGAGVEADTGITGLALLALLGAGHTHLEGEHRRVVQHGLEFLLRSQKSDGNLAGAARPFAMMYCHGMATLAICEGYATTGDPRLAPYVQRAVSYTIRAQDPTSGGWRYGPLQSGDTSQFGWQVMALTSAELAGVAIPDSTRAGMLRFLRSVSSGRYGGRAAYRPQERGRTSRPMTAEALVCRLFLHERQEDALEEGADYVLEMLPGEGEVNLYYWYYGTLALAQLDGARWQRWNHALMAAVLPRQRVAGRDAGSWDPNTVWGGHGGRVYSTALATLCLEAYYRYSL